MLVEAAFSVAAVIRTVSPLNRVLITNVKVRYKPHCTYVLFNDINLNMKFLNIFIYS